MRVQKFKGIVPKYPSHLLGEGYAEVAHDVKLHNAQLAPYRTPLTVHTVPNGTKRIHQWGCCWFHWDKCVEVAEWHSNCPRLMVTGDKAYPTVLAINEDCSTGCGGSPEWRLGVPAPRTAPTVSDAKFTKPTNENWLPMSEQREKRNYVYTYVNCFDEEGPPSYPSRLIDVDDGATVVVSGFAKPPEEYGIKAINIYRSATGQRSDKDALGKVDFSTGHYLVGTIPVTSSTFVDKGFTVNVIGEGLNTHEVAEPPAGLRGIVAIPNTLVLAGFVGNTVCVSMNNQPYNWPEAHRYTLDDNVVAITPFLNYILVATDGHPYVIELKDPANNREPHTVLRMDTPLPMVRCCDTQGAVAIDKGMAYVSDRGVVVLTPREPVVLTSAWFSKDDWRQLHPEAMRLAWHDGGLYITTTDKTYLIQIEDQTFGDANDHRVTTLSVTPTTWHVNRQGVLFLLDDGEVKQWDAGDEYLPYYWKSAEMLSTRFGYFGALRLWGMGAVQVTLFAERRAVFEDAIINPLQANRLPRYGHHLSHQIAFKGIYPVTAVEFAATLRDLARV